MIRLHWNDLVGVRRERPSSFEGKKLFVLPKDVVRKTTSNNLQMAFPEDVQLAIRVAWKADSRSGSFLLTQIVKPKRQALAYELHTIRDTNT